MNRTFKTLSDVNKNTGFFTFYKTINLNHFNMLFENANSQDIIDLDNLVTDIYGESVLLSKFAEIGVDNEIMTRIVKTCDLLHFTQWKTILDTINKGLKTDINKPLTETKTYEETNSNNAKNINTETNENKLYAFDVATASDKDETQSTSNGTSENAGTREYTETINRSNGQLSSENAKTLIDFTRLNDFLNIMLKDIVDTVCLGIY